MIKPTVSLLASLLTAASVYAGTPVAPAPQPAPVPYEEPTLISYSNFSLGYTYTSADFLGFDVDAHGAMAGLEFSPVDHLYFALRGSWSDIDFAGVDFDYWQGSAGIGGYIPITQNIHFATEVGASYADISLADFDAGIDDWGLYVTPHFRMKWGGFETHVGVTYNSNDVITSRYNAFVRLMFEVAPQCDVFVGGNVGFDNGDAFDDVFGAQAGVRFKF